MPTRWFRSAQQRTKDMWPVGARVQHEQQTGTITAQCDQGQRTVLTTGESLAWYRVTWDDGTEAFRINEKVLVRI